MREVLFLSLLVMSAQSFASGSHVSTKEYICEKFTSSTQWGVRVKVFQGLDDKWDGRVLVYKDKSRLNEMTTSMESCKESNEIKSEIKSIPIKNGFMLICGVPDGSTVKENKSGYISYFWREKNSFFVKILRGSEIHQSQCVVK